MRTVTPATWSVWQPMSAARPHAPRNQWLPWLPAAVGLHLALLTLGASHTPLPQPQPDFAPSIEVALIPTNAADPPSDAAAESPPPAAAVISQPSVPEPPKAVQSTRPQTTPSARRSAATAAEVAQQPRSAPSPPPQEQNARDGNPAEPPQPLVNQAAPPQPAPPAAIASTVTAQPAAKTRFSGKPARDARSYLGQIAAWIDANKTYPTAAKKAKEQGVVLIGFSIDRNGNLLASSVKHSSGHVHLDQAALTTLARAAPFPPIPQFIEKDTLSIAVPIDYSLITD
mgnify:CR=1 FL=1